MESMQKVFPHLIFFLILAIALRSESIRFGGSDYLTGSVSAFEETVRLGEGVDLEVDMVGSSPAIFALEAGILDAALLFQDTAEPPLFEGYELMPLGYQGISVVVHEDNPIDSVRLNRLTGIYGGAEEFDFSQWGDLGLSEWANRPILPYIISNVSDLSSEYFRLRILSNSEYKISVRQETTRNRVLDAVRSEDTAIALTGYLGADTTPGLKIVALTSDVLETPTRPTEDSVHFGDYPLKVPLNLVYRTDKLDTLLPLLEFMLSDAFAERLEVNGIIPLPRNFRERTLLDLKLAR
jgi:phosphate transport system substrate-binding protein